MKCGALVSRFKGPGFQDIISSFRSMVLLQVNDEAVRTGLFIFGSKVQLFYTQISELTGGGRVEMRGMPPL
jgi:hypothetical protein